MAPSVNTKRYSLKQISLFFKNTKFALLKSIHFLLNTKQSIVRFFWNIIITNVIITFILIQKIGFTESLSNWKTFTIPNYAQWPYLYVIKQTLEIVNVDLQSAL